MLQESHEAPQKCSVTLLCDARFDPDELTAEVIDALQGLGRRYENGYVQVLHCGHDYEEIEADFDEKTMGLAREQSGRHLAQGGSWETEETEEREELELQRRRLMLRLELEAQSPALAHNLLARMTQEPKPIAGTVKLDVPGVLVVKEFEYETAEGESRAYPPNYSPATAKGLSGLLSDGWRFLEDIRLPEVAEHGSWRRQHFPTGAYDYTNPTRVEEEILLEETSYTALLSAKERYEDTYGEGNVMLMPGVGSDPDARSVWVRGGES